MESAALARANIPESARRPHHLVIDEFSQFMAQSEESLTRMLSETRKYNLFCVMAHQNWSQASDRLKGALQNVGLEVIVKAGRLDAEYSARLLGVVDPLSVKHTVTDEDAVERTHPTFFPLQEQWEQHTQAIQALRTGEAFIRLPSDRVQRVRTPTLPPIRPDPRELVDVQTYYQETYFQPFPSGQTVATPARPGRPVISRRPPGDKTPTGRQTVFHSVQDAQRVGSTGPEGPGERVSRKPKP